MSVLGKVGSIVRQSASKSIGSQAVRCTSYVPNAKTFIGGIPSQSDERAMDSKELLGRRMRMDDAIYRRSFGGLGVGSYGARGYSAAAGVSAASYGSNAALANVAGGGLLNLTLFWHINEGIKEILADYVHHEMTRTVMLVNLRLFLLIAAKDVFVSFAF